MILLYGVPGDGPIELITDALEYLQLPFLMLNQREFEKFQFSFRYGSNGLQGIITVGDQSIDTGSITGIYNRAMDFSVLPEAKNLEPKSAVYDQYRQSFNLLNEWIEIASCRVLNKASAMSSNSSKPFQLSLIQPFFATPPTLITNSVTKARDFIAHHGEVIYKSASSIRSVVHTLTANQMDGLEKIRSCPTQFQKKLNGTNYRVHVVGEEVFAVKVLSESVDYRYSNREGNETDLTPVQLTKKIRQSCLSLSKALDLPLAGIDLFKSNDGEWYCFEVNPSPGFSYFENATGQPIANTIALYLAGKN